MDRPCIIAPLKPSLVTVRSSSSAARLRVGGRQRREGGEALRVGGAGAASRSLTPRASAAAPSAGSFCADGAPCEITCMSMPASSISLRRSAPRSNSRSSVSAAAGLRPGVMLGQLGVPVMLLDGDDRAIRLLEHDASPYARRSASPSNRRVACHRRAARGLANVWRGRRKMCFEFGGDLVMHRLCCRFCAYFRLAA